MNYNLAILLVFSLLIACLMAAKDFYQVLGVSRTATTKEIKRAFRKLAHQYHPDKNKSKEAEQMYLDINRAHEILTDKNKRAQYDRYGESAFRDGDGGGGGDGFGDDMFSTFFSGGDGRTFFHQGDGDDFFSNIFDSHDDFHQQSHANAHGSSMFNGGGFFDDGEEDEGGGGFFSSMFGGGGGSKQGHFGDSFFGSGEASSYGSGGQNCKTITTKRGNTVLTHTECH